MSMRTHVEELLQESDVEGQFWGAVGMAAAGELNRRAGAPLPASLLEFARDVGNLNVGGMSIIVTGNGTGNDDCLTQTRAADLTADAIVIMDYAGRSYLVERHGAVTCVETVGTDRDELERFADLRAFLEWVIHVSAEPNEFFLI